MVVVPGQAERIQCPEDAVQVMLVDRRPLFLAALGEIVRDGCPRATIQTVTDSEQAIAEAGKRTIDLLFCEARAMPFSGAELAAQLKAARTKTRVILLGEPDDQQLLISSLSSGAAGFFTKDASPEEFIDGINAVLAGHCVLGHSLVGLALRLLGDRAPKVPNDRLELLSEAERSILTLVGRAESTKAIAAKRGISPKTVRNHLASIYRKLDVRNRSEAIVWCTRAGLVDAFSLL